MKKIYLAGPYTHSNKDIMTIREKELSLVAARLLATGYLVFSPITQAVPLTNTHVQLPHTWEFWEKLDFSFIKDWANEVWVLNLTGWEQSVGVTAEITYAQELGIPVKLLSTRPGEIPHTRNIKINKIWIDEKSELIYKGETPY